MVFWCLLVVEFMKFVAFNHRHNTTISLIKFDDQVMFQAYLAIDVLHKKIEGVLARFWCFVCVRRTQNPVRRTLGVRRALGVHRAS